MRPDDPPAATPPDVMAPVEGHVGPGGYDGPGILLSCLPEGVSLLPVRPCDEPTIIEGKPGGQ